MQEYIKNIRIGNTTLIISNNEVIRIVKSLEDSGLLLEEVSETGQNEVKNKKEGFLVCF